MANKLKYLMTSSLIIFNGNFTMDHNNNYNVIINNNNNNKYLIIIDNLNRFFFNKNIDSSYHNRIHLMNNLTENSNQTNEDNPQITG